MTVSEVDNKNMTLRQRNNIELLRSRFLLTIFFFFVAYHLIGILPVAPIVGDGIAIANGATQAAESELGPNQFSYRYDSRSGVYALIVALHKLTDLDSLWLFSIACGFASIVFVLFSAALVHEVTACPFALSGIVILLFQESFTGGFYANTPVIAGAFVLPALYLLKAQRHLGLHVFAGFLIGIAIWMRFDVVLLAPAALILLHRNSWKKTAVRALVVSVTTIVTTAVAMYLSNVSLQAIINSLIQHKSTAELDQIRQIKVYLRFFSILLIALIGIGLFHAIRQRNWYLIITFLFGTLPFLLVLGGTINNTKLMYYYIPFFAIPVAYAILRMSGSSGRSLRQYVVLIALLFVGQYLVGIRSSSADIEVGVPLVNTSIPLTLFNSRQEHDETVVLVLGSGITGGGPFKRLLSGTFYAPLWWFVRKNDFNREVNKLVYHIVNNNNKTINILATYYLERMLTHYILLRAGFSFDKFEKNEDTARYFFTKGDQTAIFTTLPGKDTYAFLARPDLTAKIYVTRRPINQELLQERGQDWDKISKLAYQVE